MKEIIEVKPLEDYKLISSLIDERKDKRGD